MQDDLQKKLESMTYRLTKTRISEKSKYGYRTRIYLQLSYPVMLSVEKHRNLLKVSFKPLEILLFVDAWMKHQLMSISVGVPNPFVSIASWATQKILFSKLILERSNEEFL